ncbi:glycosyltransferase [Leuconostoc pseudomesenteroides]|uniref:glycosyltransferase n=1 Tax=Leuconostoc pseudomesenteroides TaxID=33968 RepID=UPI0039E760B4
MIFVTVGTHEQGFNRLVKFMDEYAETTDEEVIIQEGYSSYPAENSTVVDFVSYARMAELISKARIVITHGGPATFLSVIDAGKKPIVVPRMKKFSEHVNDHQLDFAKKMVDVTGNLYVVTEVSEIPTLMNGSDFAVDTTRVGAESDSFVERFEALLTNLIQR